MSAATEIGERALVDLARARRIKVGRWVAANVHRLKTLCVVLVVPRDARAGLGARWEGACVAEDNEENDCDVTWGRQKRKRRHASWWNS